MQSNMDALGTEISKDYLIGKTMSENMRVSLQKSIRMEECYMGYHYMTIW